MAKEKKEVVIEAEVAPVAEAPVVLEEVKVEKGPKALSDREVRWAKHVASYKVSNPVKWARKNANKEFDEVPATFL